MTKSQGVPVAADVSVIIPTFRRPHELTEALHSVLDQRGVSVEVFVVDDSPEGAAAAVVSDFGDARLTYLRNPNPTGGVPGIVRNLAWPQAAGRFVHFLDDDDLVPEGHYAASCAEFEAYPEVGMIFGRVEPFGEDAESVKREKIYFERAERRARSCQRLGQQRAFAASLMFKETMLVCSAALVRRECIAAVNGFDVNSRLVEDVDFYSRIARSFGVLFTERVVLHYRIGLSLIHRPNVQSIIERSYQLMHHNYQRQWGRLDFLAMKLFAKTVLRAA